MSARPAPGGCRSDGCFFGIWPATPRFPSITVAALEISNLLAGAVIVETVFAWPGLGQVTVQSILARDFLVVQGVVLLGAFVTVALNLAADLLYSVVDPRIRSLGAVDDLRNSIGPAATSRQAAPFDHAMDARHPHPPLSSWRRSSRPWSRPTIRTAQNLLGRMKPPGTVVPQRSTICSAATSSAATCSAVSSTAPRVSLFVAFASVLLSGVVGVVLGMLAGYLRGWVELIVMRVVDVFLSIPAILLAIITVAVLGPGPGATSSSSWP